jgi:tetratricopeptide (TPR) repeat protein
MSGPTTASGERAGGQSPPAAIALAREHYCGGRLQESEATCRQVLEHEPAHADALHLLGVLAHRVGRNDAAIDLISRAAALSPDNPEVHYNLGVAQQVGGQLANAAASYRRALSLQPERADAHNNLGYALLRLGRLDDALTCCDEALRLQPDFAEALANRGEALILRGRNEDAVTALRQALRVRPDFPEAHNHLGVALRELGQRDEADACFHQALRLRPDFAGAHNNLGRLCEDRGRPDEAAARYRLALCYQPHDILLHCNLANVLAKHGKSDEALPAYRQALRLQPNEAVLHSNIAHTLTLLGRPDEAEESCRAALRIRPEFPDAHHNLAITLAAQGRLDEALAANAEALRLQPENPGARNCRALWWLQQGDFERGWPEYEWRWAIQPNSRRSFPQPLWDGSDLNGRSILVHAEQALGDTIQFIRYAQLVKQRGGTVVVESQPPLLPLLRNCPGIDRLVAHKQPLPPCDVHAPLLSLPGVFRTTLATVPTNVPYLFADPKLVEQWKRTFDASSFNVGIAWQGSASFPGDRMRSIPLAHFAPLARVAGVRLFGLQKGTGREQIKAVARRVSVIDLGDRLDEAGAFLDTAAVMQGLDLVITSDTAIAHLAGALGVPVWVALSVGPDWRWLRDREDCPWYPTMRLFRQRRSNDWDEVFDRMAAELRQKLAPSPGTAIAVPIAAGELIDKITILEIKADRITEPSKLRNVRTELAALRDARDWGVPDSTRLAELTSGLREVNETLWQIEDDIRLCERNQDFGPRFVELARAVYHTNDRRSAIKSRINELLGSELVEEKTYTRYESTGPAEPLAETPPRATVCILTYGDYLPYFRRCLDSILQNTPARAIELRLGFNEAPASAEYARQRLVLGSAGDAEALAGGVHRSAFTGPGGMTIRVWNSPVNRFKEPMARLLYHDVPLATEYAVWFDDDSFVEPGWWPALCAVFDRGADYIGQSWWVNYLPGQEEMIRSRPWYRGVPFETHAGRTGVWFMTGGFMAVRSQRLCEANFPDTDFRWKGDTLKQYGGDTLLGEIARQLGWTQAVHDAHVKVNVDLQGHHPAPRRGGTGRQFGSDVDLVIR